jgi:tRNA-specific 2-thiouridylase
LEIAVGSPLYVTEIVPETNTVVLGTEEDLKKQQLSVRNLNLIKFDSVYGSMEALTKIRYKTQGTVSTITQTDETHLNVLFHEPVSAIAPGQSAVFYDGNDLIGGGFIEKKK